jgi:hypothetical protein
LSVAVGLLTFVGVMLYCFSYLSFCIESYSSEAKFIGWKF